MGKGITAIVLGVISFGLLLALSSIIAVLIAFAPQAAFLPLIPSTCLSLIGLPLSVYTKKKNGNKPLSIIGIIINSICFSVIAAAIALIIYAQFFR